MSSNKEIVIKCVEHHLEHAREIRDRSKRPFEGQDLDKRLDDDPKNPSPRELLAKYEKSVDEHESALKWVNSLKLK